MPDFCVVYSKATGRIRSIVKPDTDSQLDKWPVNQGEALARFPEIEYGSLDDLQEKLTSLTGLTPTNDRYAIVDSNGDVKGALVLDPECGDALTDVELIPHDKAIEGWKYDRQAGFRAFTTVAVEEVIELEE